MKIVFGILVMLVCVSAGAFAQDKPNAERITAKMSKELMLTDGQAAAVKTIVAESVAQREELLKKMQAEMAVFQQQMEQVKAAEKQKLSNVLTPDQMKTWQFIKSKKHVRHHSNGAAAVEGRLPNAK